MTSAEETRLRRLATLKIYYLAAITSYNPFDGARARRNKLLATNVELSSESDELWKYEIHILLNNLRWSSMFTSLPVCLNEVTLIVMAINRSGLMNTNVMRNTSKHLLSNSFIVNLGHVAV